MTRTWTLLFLLAVGLAPARAAAEAVIAVDEFSPLHERELVGLSDFTFDTDWFPMDAALQLRLIVHGADSVRVSMPGEGRYDWTTESVAFAGTPGAGSFTIDVGFTLDAKIRFDVLGIQWESDIIGPYDYAITSESVFTPYLLPGNPGRPVVVEDQTGTETVVSVPVTPDIVIAAGNLNIDAYAIVAASLAGEAIEASTQAPQPQWQKIEAEGASAELLAGPGPTPDPLEVEGVLVCSVMTAPTIVLKPTLVMEILGMEYEIADIEIPVALPTFDDVIRFDPVAMQFPRPVPEAASTGADSEGDSAGGSGEPTTGGANGGETGVEGGSSGADSASGGAGAPVEDGCGCRSGGLGGSGARASMLVLALLGLTRRRRSAR